MPEVVDEDDARDDDGQGDAGGGDRVHGFGVEVALVDDSRPEHGCAEDDPGDRRRSGRTGKTIDEQEERPDRDERRRVVEEDERATRPSRDAAVRNVVQLGRGDARVCDEYGDRHRGEQRRDDDELARESLRVATSGPGDHRRDGGVGASSTSAAARTLSSRRRTPAPASPRIARVVGRQAMSSAVSAYSSSRATRACASTSGPRSSRRSSGVRHRRRVVQHASRLAAVEARQVHDALGFDGQAEDRRSATRTGERLGRGAGEPRPERGREASQLGGLARHMDRMGRCSPGDSSVAQKPAA